jgi:osmoprotectant transport system ATP-binding protein
VLMAQGKIVQNSTPADLLRNPASPFVTAFIGEDRGMRALQFTTLAELAGPAPAPIPANGLVLPGTLSILEAARELGVRGDATGDGVWVGDDAGQPTGFVSYQKLAATLGETLAAEDAASGVDAAAIEGEAVHAIHH